MTCWHAGLLPLFVAGLRATCLVPGCLAPQPPNRLACTLTLPCLNPIQANSAILNALLTLLNERLFDNGSERITVPLTCLVRAGVRAAAFIRAGCRAAACNSSLQQRLDRS